MHIGIGRLDYQWSNNIITMKLDPTTNYIYIAAAHASSPQTRRRPVGRLAGSSDVASVADTAARHPPHCNRLAAAASASRPATINFIPEKADADAGDKAADVEVWNLKVT
jgi:hypothetical protein